MYFEGIEAVSRQNQDSVGNHFLLEFLVQFTLLVYEEEV